MRKQHVHTVPKRSLALAGYANPKRSLAPAGYANPNEVLLLHMRASEWCAHCECIIVCTRRQYCWFLDPLLSQYNILFLTYKKEALPMIISARYMHGLKT